MKRKKFFYLYASTFLTEYMALPDEVDISTILLSSKKRFENAYSSFSKKKIKKIYIPKFGKGRFGQDAEPTYIDHFIYLIFTFFYLPFILTYDAIIFTTPPFFNSLIIPFLRLFRKDIYIVVMDSQIDLALSYKKKMSLMRKLMLKIARFLEFYSIRKATKVFVVSNYLVNLYNGLNKNIFLVPNGADVELIRNIKPKRLFRNFTITYLGGFERYRGLDLLIDSFREIKKTVDAELVLIGSGINFDEIKEYAKNDKNIHFLGYVDHNRAVSYVKGSDVVVMPSRKSIQSKTISSIKCFEYIASGIPQIVTDSGDHAYWIKKLNTGLIVNDNLVDIAKSILKLKKNKKLYRRLKENCIKRRGEIDYKIFRKIFFDELS